MTADHSSHFGEAQLELLDEFFVVTMGCDHDGIVEGNPCFQLVNVARLPRVMVVHLHIDQIENWRLFVLKHLHARARE